MDKEEEQHKRFMKRCDGGDDGDKHFAAFMIKYAYTKVLKHLDSIEDAKEAFKGDIKFAYLEMCRISQYNLQEPRTYAMLESRNYGRLLYDVAAVDKHENYHEGDYEEFERFYKLFMEMVKS